MNHFVNEYRYTDAMIEEAMGAWWKWKYKKIIYGTLAAMVVFLIIWLFTKNPTYLICEILFALIFLTMHLNKKKSMQNEKQRRKVMYPDEPPLIRVEIGEDIRIHTKDTDRSVAFSQLEGIKETGSTIVLCISGMMTIALSKNGFKEGSAQDCIAFLRERTGKK